MNEIIKKAASFLSGMDAEINLADGRIVMLTKTETPDGWTYNGEGVIGSVTVRTDGETAVFFADFHSENTLDERFSITFAPSFDEKDEIIASALDYGTVYWLYPTFPKSAAEFPYAVSNMLVHRGEKHYNFTMLLGDGIRTEWDMNGLHFGNRVPSCDLCGSFLAVTSADDPYTAVKKCYRGASSLGGIRVPLVESRPLPKLFRGFGYCSWNTFYHDVSSAGLYEKLDEFKKKNVPVTWMIIDDGWANVTENEQLVSMTEDRKKFPEGLKECIRRIKEEYGVKYVGIWHTLNYWWFGIDPDSELAKDYADCFQWSSCVPGREELKKMLIPSDDSDKAFRFWDDWHGYLEECGVDFVKVDNQSSAFYYLGGVVPASSGTRHLHEAIERSIEKHFGGVAIDCMGMDMANALSRPYTAVTRSSDDFYPNNPNGFYKHLTQNAYNALWHSELYHCDYDMWWSGRSNPVESGLLRAISGGPVYVSDALGVTNEENIYPICGKDGQLEMFDHAGLPTADEIYRDVKTENVPFKVYNRYNDCLALAVFNPNCDKADETFALSVIPEIEGGKEYIAYEYFTKTFARVSAETKISLSLGKNEVRAYSLFPIKKDADGEFVLLGDTERYFPAATPAKRKTSVSELIK